VVITSGAEAGPTNVAPAGSGSFVVGWTTRLQRVSAAGVLQGAPIELPFQGNLDFTTFTQRALSGDAAGELVVSWVCPDAQATPRVCVQPYSADGSPKTAVPLIAGTTTVAGTGNVLTADIGSTSVAMTTGGDFVVAWTSHLLHTYNGSLLPLYSANSVNIRRFHADGTPYAGVHRVGTKLYWFRDQAAGHANVSMAPDNSYVVTWTEPNADYARFYTADGRTASAAVKLSTDAPAAAAATGSRAAGSTGTGSTVWHEFFASSLAPNGDLLWVYDTVEGSTDTVYLRRCSAYCSVSGSPVFVATRPVAGQVGLGGLTVEATAQNGSIVSWGDESTQIVSAQAFTASDVAVGPRFTIGVDSTMDPNRNPSLSTAVDDSGNLIAAWGAIKARVFQGP
jgi:hypothetical protein